MIASERSLASSQQPPVRRYQTSGLRKSKNGVPKPPVRAVKVYVLDPKSLQQRLEAYVGQKNKKETNIENEKSQKCNDEDKPICPIANNTESTAPTSICFQSGISMTKPEHAPLNPSTFTAPNPVATSNVIPKCSQQDKHVLENVIPSQCIPTTGICVSAVPLVVSNGVRLMQTPVTNSRSGTKIHESLLPSVTDIPTGAPLNISATPEPNMDTPPKRKPKKKRKLGKKKTNGKDKDDDDDSELTYLRKETTTRLGRISRPVSQPHSPAFSALPSSANSRVPSPTHKKKRRSIENTEEIIIFRCETCQRDFITQKELNFHLEKCQPKCSLEPNSLQSYPQTCSANNQGINDAFTTLSDAATPNPLGFCQIQVCPATISTDSRQVAPIPSSVSNTITTTLMLSETPPVIREGVSLLHTPISESEAKIEAKGLFLPAVTGIPPTGATFTVGGSPTTPITPNASNMGSPQKQKPKKKRKVGKNKKSVDRDNQVQDQRTVTNTQGSLLDSCNFTICNALDGCTPTQTTSVVTYSPTIAPLPLGFSPEAQEYMLYANNKNNFNISSSDSANRELYIANFCKRSETLNVSLVPNSDEPLKTIHRSIPSSNVNLVPSSYSIPSSPPSQCQSPGFPDNDNNANIIQDLISKEGTTSPGRACHSPIDPMLLRSRSPFPPPLLMENPLSVSASNLSIPEESLCKGELFMDLSETILEPDDMNKLPPFCSISHSVNSDLFPNSPLKSVSPLMEDHAASDNEQIADPELDTEAEEVPTPSVIVGPILATEDANDGEIFQAANYIRTHVDPPVIPETPRDSLISASGGVPEQLIENTEATNFSELPKTPLSTDMDNIDFSIDSADLEHEINLSQKRSVWEFVKEQIQSCGISQACGEISEMADKLSRIARDQFIPIREEEIERLGNSAPVIHVDTPFFSHLLDLPYGTYVFREEAGQRKRDPPPPPITSSELSFTGGVDDVEKFLPPNIDLIPLPHLTNLDLI